ncbi:MAG: S8 family serine peptidase [Planctomycetota bacterium]
MMRILLGMAVLIGLATTGFAQIDDQPDPILETTTVFDPEFGDREVIAGEVLVQFNAIGNQMAWAGIHQVVGTGVLENITPSLHRVKLPATMQIEDAIAQYQSFGEVDFAEPNWIYYTSDTPNDPQWNQQWGPKKINADDAWDTFKGDPNYIVAVVDTGVDIDHSDLADDYAFGYDYWSNDSNPNDTYGHGTHCSGIAAAETNNGIGIAGVARDCRFAAYRTGSGGSLSVSAIVSSINHARTNGAHVNSMSFGGGSSQSMANALTQAWNAGMVNVAAAGNAGNTQQQYPAAYSNVIAVASSTTNDGRSSFSTYGSWVSVAAPGSNIQATWLSNGYTSISGTSMACPHVAGQAALLYAYLGAARTTGNAQTIRDAIQDSAVNVGTWVQHGRVDVAASLLALNPPGPPSVNVVTPNTASSCGAETITLTGTDLAQTTDVSVGGNSVSFTVVNNQTVTFTSPFKATNLNSDQISLTTPFGNDSSKSLGYFAQAEPDIRGTTFIFKPGGGSWTECGCTQSNGSGCVYVEFVGSNGGSTPLGNGVSVPVGNGQLWTVFSLSGAGTHQSTLPGYNGNFVGAAYFGMATFDIVQGKWTSARPTPFRVTIF